MTILKNILSFTGLSIGVATPLPHLLNVNGHAVLPHVVLQSQPGFTVTANLTNVTVTRTTGGTSLLVYTEHWHTIEDVEPPGGLGAFIPFIASGGGAVAGIASTAMFFGTTTGTGSAGNDYAATVAVGAPVPFPRNGPAQGTHIVRSGVSTTNFVVDVTGVYQVSWSIQFTEANQLELAVVTAGPTFTPIANTCATSGAGTQVNAKTVLISLTAGDVIALINPAGNAAALTVTPSDGSLTHAQAPTLVAALIA